MRPEFDSVIDRHGTDSLKWDTSPNDTIPMWVADMDFPVAECIKDAVMRRAESGIYGYPIIPEDLYQSYMEWWSSRHDFDIRREWMIFCTGVIPAINSIIQSMTGPDELILLQTPAYNTFFRCILESNRSPKEVSLGIEGDRYVMDLEALEKGLSDPKVKLMILCNPHNPVGRIWDRDTLIKVAEMCKEHGVTVISDEIHCDLTEPGIDYVPFLSVSDTAKEIGITCIAPTKSFNMAGLRSSMILVPNKELRQKVFDGVKRNGVSSPNTFSVDATISAFRYGKEWLDDVREYIFDNRDIVRSFLKENLPELELFHNEATYLLWIRIPYETPDGSNIADLLTKNAKVMFSDGSIFGSDGKGFIRMNIACPRSLLMEGLERLKNSIMLNFK